MQDAVWNRVTANREKHKTTWFYIDEFHLLLKGQTGAFSVEIWKRFRKWGGIPSGLTQNVKDLLASREIENIFENSDFIYMLNQAQGDRQILAKQLGISLTQLSYVTHSGPGEGPFVFRKCDYPLCRSLPEGHQPVSDHDDPPGGSRGGRDVIIFFTAWRMGGDAVAKG